MNRGAGNAVSHWVFDAMLYTFATTGGWDVPGNWFEGVLPAATDNITVPNLVTLTLNGDETINDITIDNGGTIVVGGNTFTVNGASDIDGTITAVAGTVDANGTFDATSGNVTFTGAGSLTLSGVVTSLGTLTDATNGTVTYDGAGAQSIVSDDYVNLIVGGGAATTKTLAGAVVVAGAFTTDALVTTAMGANNLTVAGATTIEGTLDVAGSTLTLNGGSDVNGTITTAAGIVDANGTFDATGGNVTFTGAGSLTLSGAVTSLGTLTDAANGTVTYDGAGAQNIVADSYVNLIVGGGAATTKTLLGIVIVAGAFTTDALVTTAMGANNLTVAGATDINGTVTMTTATLDANGAFDATGGTIDINGIGYLTLASTVTDLGTLSIDFGKVTYDGTAQTIFADTYYDLTVATGNTKTLGGNLIVARDLTIDAGVTLDVSGNDYSINVARHFANSGTFTMQEGLVTFDGTDDQALTSGGSSFFAIIFNTGGAATKKLSVNGTLTMTNNLTITAGTLDLDSLDPNVNIAGDVSIANNAIWTSGSGTLTFNGTAQTFEDLNGSPNNLGNISID
jgi:hypothetical protein